MPENYLENLTLGFPHAVAAPALAVSGRQLRYWIMLTIAVLWREICCTVSFLPFSFLFKLLKCYD